MNNNDLNSLFLGNNNLSAPPVQMTRKTESKKQVLVWSDCILASTGFATVSKHIMSALHNTGQYELDQLAINSIGEFYDTKMIPYCIMPAKLGDASDPYGSQMFVNALQRKEYDIVLVINDTFVVEEVARRLEDVRKIKAQRGQKPFALVYYYPVDCRLLPQATTMIKFADRAVAYTNFAAKSSEEIGIKPSDVIYHGTDIKTFHPIPAADRTVGRKRWFGIDNDDTFVFINVNRNSARKDIARSIYAFAEFRKQVPNSLMYIHAKVKDSAGGHLVDLEVPMRELKLDMTKDIIFPNKFSAARGFPVEVLNQLYCCADAYITTHLGEGWGLTITEAMACEIPVVAPNNTTAPEILSNDRGYVYPCNEVTYIDNSGYRSMGRTEDIVEQMMRCYNDWKSDSDNRKQILHKAKQFVRQYSWTNVCKEWLHLFKKLKPGSIETKNLLEGELV